MPRQFPLAFRKMGKMPQHYAMIGMATVVEGIPLFYDATNEYGLSMAGLNFPGNAYYGAIQEGKENITPFEFIPWVLGQCKTITETKALLARINLIDLSFSKHLPLSPLHWMIADGEASIVVESRKDGLYLHDNSVNVLTNNPPFEYQLSNLERFATLRIDNAEIVREENLNCDSYCQGLGAVGLPGDVSSMSRFVRAAFSLKNSVCEEDELSSVGQFFHLLSVVEMVRGNCKTDEGTLDITRYSACMNTKRGLYYYVTYDNRQITCVDLHGVDLDAAETSRFPLLLNQNILYQK